LRKKRKSWVASAPGVLLSRDGRHKKDSDLTKYQTIAARRPIMVQKSHSPGNIQAMVIVS